MCQGAIAHFRVSDFCCLSIAVESCLTRLLDKNNLNAYVVSIMSIFSGNGNTFLFLPTTNNEQLTRSHLKKRILVQSA
jgi:hypothetical protein